MLAKRSIPVLALLGLAAVCNAKVITVDDGGPADFATIQAAVDAAGDGDTVEIRPGTYRGAGNRDIEVWGKAITIRSIDPNDPAVVNATVIDCNDPEKAPHRGFRLIGQTPQIVLAGMTITGGRGSLAGGGVECLGFVTVSRCRILDCSASRGGGVFGSGLWWEELSEGSTGGDGGTVRILDCQIERNAAREGGGLYVSSDYVLVKGCVIGSNRAEGNGGGLAGDFTIADLENDIIRGNRAREGGGVWLRETAATVADCWLAGNWAARGGGALAVRNTSCLGTPEIAIKGSTLVGNETAGEAGGVFLQELDSDELPYAYGHVTSSILWRNEDRTGSGLAAQICGPVEAAYSCIQGSDPNGLAESHNLAGDPLLVRWPDDGGDGWGDDPDTNDIDESRNDDFGDPHLRPGSPCIQAGDPAALIPFWAVDLDGQPRRMDKIVEIGVDEYSVSGIAILRPRGGEILVAGTTREVAWQGPASPRRLRVDFSVDGGDHWQTLDANAPFSGRLTWQVPETVQSDVCLIRATPTPALSTLEVAYSELFSIYPAGSQGDIASGWRTLGANFQRTGRSRVAGPLVGCLRWRFDASSAITSGPVVGRNSRIHLGTYDGQVCTLDANGRLLWVYETHDALLGTPTVAEDGTLYVCSHSGRLHVLTPEGQLRRSYSISPTDSSAAFLPDGRLVVGSGILDPYTGLFRSFWMVNQTAGFSSPALGPDALVYAAAWDQPGLYAFDSVSGGLKWGLVSTAQGRPFAGPVVGDNGLVYQTFLDDSFLYAADAKTGALAWATDLADPCAVTSDGNLFGVESWFEPVLGPDGTVYAGLDDPFLRAVDPATGQIKWMVRLGSGRGFTLAVDKQGYLYAASDDGSLYVVDAQGRLVSSFESNTPLSCPVIAADGLLLVVGAQGTGLDEAADVLYAIAADPTCLVLRPPRDPRAEP